MWIVSTYVVPLNRWYSNRFSYTFSPNILGTLANDHQITTLSNMRLSFKIKQDYCNMGPVELIFLV